MTNLLDGVWTLRAHQREVVDTGERTDTFGPDPRGTLIFHADGQLAVMLTPREQMTPASDAERAAAFKALVAYAGRYRLEAPDRLVTTVDVAWFAPWVGTEQVRTYRLDGDTLELRTPAGRMPGADGDGPMVAGVLTWVRAAAA